MKVALQDWLKTLSMERKQEFLRNVSSELRVDESAILKWQHRGVPASVRPTINKFTPVDVQII